MAPLVHMVTTPAFTGLDKKCFIRVLRAWWFEVDAKLLRAVVETRTY
jgi:hypothetical protein